MIDTILSVLAFLLIAGLALWIIIGLVRLGIDAVNARVESSRRKAQLRAELADRYRQRQAERDELQDRTRRLWRNGN